MRLRWICIVLVFLLSACNMSVTSFTVTPPPVATVTAKAESATPYPDTPAPAALDAPRIESPALVNIKFINDLDGWGITGTRIVRTNDGGLNWYDVTPPDVEETGFGVETFVLDNQHVWVQKSDFNNFPNNGLLYHTADGGLTWSLSSTPFSGGDLSFVDDKNGWMLADLGVGAGSNAVAVFQTADGGATWTQTYTNDPNAGDAGDSLPLGGLKSDLVPLDMQTAFVGGVVYSPGTVYLYRTDDGGRSWSPVNLPLPDSAENSELSINEDQMGFLTGEEGFLTLYMAGDSPQTAVYTTADGGATWTLTPALIPGAGEADFLSAQEAVIYNGEQFYVTRDAARTWATVTPNIAFGDSFASMDFTGLNTGWVLTIAEEDRSFYRTHDGGATWLPVTP